MYVYIYMNINIISTFEYNLTTQFNSATRFKSATQFNSTTPFNEVRTAADEVMAPAGRGAGGGGK